MNILVIGGTRFFGIPMIEELLKSGHDVTIATRGLSADSFGSRVKRLILDRTDFSYHCLLALPLLTVYVVSVLGTVML